MHYEVICTSCKRTFKLYEGEEQYKQYKEHKSHLFYCEDCKHKIRFDAIRNFFWNYYWRIPDTLTSEHEKKFIVPPCITAN